VVQILPSILAADFARLGEQIKTVEAAGVEMLHVDIMDGHFVPNLTLGPPVTECIRRVTRLKLDHHLMIEDPDFFAPIFIKAGATSVSVQQEACRNLHRTLQMIRQEGALAGVVINPATPVTQLDDVLEVVDYVLVMSVNPGFGGQEFIPHSIEKVRQLERRPENAAYILPSKSMAAPRRKTWPMWFAPEWTGWSQARPFSTQRTRRPRFAKCNNWRTKQL